MPTFRWYIDGKVRDDLDSVELIQTINEISYNETDDIIIDTLEEYIKDVRLKQVYQKYLNITIKDKRKRHKTRSKNMRNG